METILQNMCMIYDRDNDKILILDKVKNMAGRDLPLLEDMLKKGKSYMILALEKFLKKPD